MQFQKATKKQAKLRLFLAGPSGSGKTYSALAIATALGKRVALIDTEHHSAEKYADLFEFETLNLDVPSLAYYEDAMAAASKAAYDVLIIDSLSHAWYAAQEMVDVAASRMKSANTYMAWGTVTPLWNDFLRKIITTNCHVIGTSRSKCEYVLEEVKGKQVPRKVGMAPIMRDGAEYEFDVSAELDLEHRLLIQKTRCPALDGKVFQNPGADVAEILLAWLSEGVEPEPPKEPTPKPKELPPEQKAFNDWINPLISQKKIERAEVGSILEANQRDYAKAKTAIEAKIGATA